MDLALRKPNHLDLVHVRWWQVGWLVTLPTWERELAQVCTWVEMMSHLHNSLQYIKVSPSSSRSGQVIPSRYCSTKELGNAKVSGFIDGFDDGREDACEPAEECSIYYCQFIEATLQYFTIALHEIFVAILRLLLVSSCP